MAQESRKFGRDAQAANYRRLLKSRPISSLARNLERHGVNARTFELYMRLIAAIPRRWKQSNETFKQAESRRACLAGKLRRLASELRKDPEATLIQFSPGLAAYTGIPDDGERMLTFADLMDIEATFLEGSDYPRVQMPDGEIVSERERDRLSRPLRSAPLRSYALKSIFELLQPHFVRAPNKEAELVASVLLQERITPGAMTHLRRNERRRYVREKQ
jgi:hypothetical protein